MKIRGKSVEEWRTNAEGNYGTTPISVLKYITILEECLIELTGKAVTELNERNSVDEVSKSFAFCDKCTWEVADACELHGCYENKDSK